MLNYNPVTLENGECIIVGRGATAIYLILSDLVCDKDYVLVPANICYAAVFPILNAGFKPLFCDVDKFSGNITIKEIKSKINKNIVAAIIPHMYGNPVVDLPVIKKELHKKDILLIEDCASLMTNKETINYKPGTIGDYVIYSTGYSKTIDCGIGGLLFSKSQSLKSIEMNESRLPLYDESFSEETGLFSKIYRLLRNHNKPSKLKDVIFQSLQGDFKNNFIYRISNDTKKSILSKIKNLDQIIIERNRQFDIYTEQLENKYILYNFNEGAIPWRFNLMIENRNEFIKYCLDNSLPVSDWYPLVTPIFGCSDLFPNAQWHEEHIINFPLLIADEEIKNMQMLV